MHSNPESGIESSVESASGEPRASQKDGAESALAPSATRGDKAQISDAGRTLDACSDGSSGLSPERAAHIRRRVLEGAYGSLAVVDEVARRLLGSGDLA